MEAADISVGNNIKLLGIQLGPLPLVELKILINPPLLQNF